MSEFTFEEYLQQGQVLLGGEKYEEAVEKLDKALELDERSVDAYISKGIALAYLDRLDQAEESLQRAITVKKDCGEAYFHLGNVSFMKDDYVEAIKNFNLAVANGYDSADVYYLIGLMYEQCEDMLQALRNYSKAIRLDELNPVYRIKKAVLEFSLSDYESVVETSAGLRQYCPDNYEGYHLGAAALTMQKKYKEAREVLESGKALYPEDTDIMMDLVRIALAEGKYDEAKQILTEAQKCDPTDDDLKEIFLSLGKIYIAEENTDEGIKYLEKSLEIGSFGEKDFETEFVLVNAFNSLKQYDKMLAMANRIIEGHGEEPYAISGRYFAALAKKNIPGEDYKAAYLDAIRFYRQFTLQQAARVDGYVYRAMCHRDLEEYDKAIECLDYVLLISPNSKELHLIKGGILKEMGKEKESAEEMRLAERLKSAGLPGFLGGEE